MTTVTFVCKLSRVSWRLAKRSPSSPATHFLWTGRTSQPVVCKVIERAVNLAEEFALASRRLSDLNVCRMLPSELFECHDRARYGYDDAEAAQYPSRVGRTSIE